MKIQLFEKRINYLDGKTGIVVNFDEYSNFDELKETLADSTCNRYILNCDTLEQIKETMSAENDELVIMFER